MPILARLIPGLPVARDATDFMALHMHFLSPSSIKEVSEKAAKLKDFISKNHTYHVRLSRLLHSVGFITESAEMLR